MSNSLAEYLVNDIFKWYKDEREANCEPQWRRNYDAFMGRYDSGMLETWKALEGNKWRSRVFVRLTHNKIIAGYNNIVSVSMQQGSIPFTIDPADKPVIDLMKKHLTECKADREYISSILEGSIYSTSWLMGPVMKSKKITQVIQTPYGPTVINREIQYPGFVNPGVWNVYADPECSQYDEGLGLIVREEMGKGRFEKLKYDPSYDQKAIDEVLNQYASNDESNGNYDDSPYAPTYENLTKRRRIIPVYRFYGSVPVKYLDDEFRSVSDDARETDIMCVCAGNTPVVIRKPVENPFSYIPVYKAIWNPIPGEAGGIGIAESMEDSQMVINGLTRSMLDNKSLASNLLMAWNPRFLAPGQNKSLFPGKSFELAENTQDIRQALQFFYPPDNTNNTIEQIKLFQQFADDETGLSRVLEGNAGPANRTAFEMSKMVEAGNKMLSGVIRNYDEGIIEPAMTGLYHWLLLNGQINGQYSVEAKGFQGYRDKGIRGQNLLNLLQFAMSNQLTAQITNVFEFIREIAIINDIDPDRFFPMPDQNQIAQAEMMNQMLPQSGGGEAGIGNLNAMGAVGGMPNG